MISWFSLIAAILLFNLSMVAVAFARRKTGFMIKYSTSALLLLCLLGALRTLLPLDFQFAKVVNSFVILPHIIGVLTAPVFPAFAQFSVALVIAVVWIGGSVYIAIRLIFRIFRDSQKRKGYRLITCQRSKDLLAEYQCRGATVVVSPDIPTPMVTGIKSACIYLPDLLYTDQELHLIFKHELQHFKSRDILIKLFYCSLLAIFWWNPIVHRFQRELEWLLELRCDMNVTKKLNKLERIAYLEIILRTLRLNTGTQHIDMALASQLAQNETDLFIRQRFELVLSDSRTKMTGRHVISLCLTLLLFMGSFFIIVQPAYEAPAHENSTDIVAISPQNSFVIRQGESYLVYVNNTLWGEFPHSVIVRSFQDLPIINQQE